MRTKLGSLVVVAAGTLVWLVGIPAAAAGSPSSLVPPVTISEIGGGTPVTLKTSELASLPQQTDTVTIAGTQTTETGPLVSALMTLAGVQYNAQCSNDELRYWVEATSANGQAVEIGAGELDPFYGNRPAILSIDQNGTFLTSSGPRLVVPNDSTDARDIEHVTRITIGRSPVELADTATPACGTAGQMPDPAPGTVVINGDVANPMTLTMAQLQSLPQVSQTDTFLSGSRSSTNSESGPTLYSILEAAQPKFLACDPNDKLRFSVEVTSSEDGFAGIFSWAEIDPQLDNVPALLSLVNNGVPVLQTDTDPRSTAADDVHGGRYIYGAAVLTVLRAPTEVRIPSCRGAAKP